MDRIHSLQLKQIQMYKAETCKLDQLVQQKTDTIQILNKQLDELAEITHVEFPIFINKIHYKNTERNMSSIQLKN